MFEIKDILEETTDITFKFKSKDGTETEIEVSVLTESMTPGVLSDLQKAQKDENISSMVDAIAQFLVRWSICYKGEDFPCTRENMLRVPISFHMALVEAVMETWSGNELKPSE